MPTILTRLDQTDRGTPREKLTQFRRMITGSIGPHLALFPKSMWAGYLNDQMKAIESNLALAASLRADLLGGQGVHRASHRRPVRWAAGAGPGRRGPG